jgi:hypothetical protein
MSDEVNLNNLPAGEPLPFDLSVKYVNGPLSKEEPPEVSRHRETMAALNRIEMLLQALIQK